MFEYWIWGAISCIIGVAGIASCVFNDGEGEKHPWTGLLLVLAGIGIAFFSGYRVGPRAFTKDVPLTKVSVKGTAGFTAQIDISYEDGGLSKVELIPGTTVRKLDEDHLH